MCAFPHEFEEPRRGTTRAPAYRIGALQEEEKWGTGRGHDRGGGAIGEVASQLRHKGLARK